jgi:hypothetical protein
VAADDLDGSGAGEVGLYKTRVPLECRAERRG